MAFASHNTVSMTEKDDMQELVIAARKEAFINAQRTSHGASAMADLRDAIERLHAAATSRAALPSSGTASEDSGQLVERMMDLWDSDGMGEMQPNRGAFFSYLCKVIRHARAAAIPADAERLKLYDELIYAVGSKDPGESRHQTALRYIRQAETPSNVAAQSNAGTS